MSETILDLQNVSHTYSTRHGLWGKRRTTKAVDNITLRIRKGDVLGIVGESGSGKSTLARLMLGLLQPNEGKIELEGTAISSLSRQQRADRIGFIFQDPYSSLNPRQTVGQITSYPLRLRKEGNFGERAGQARRVLSDVGLPERFFDTYPGQMSGGQRQRVAIARSLITRPNLLICDEPTSALDVSVQAQVLNLLLELRQTYNLTYVIISHNMSVVQHMTTHVAVMYLGKIVEMGTVEDVFDNPKHPYTKLLISSMLNVAPGAGLPNLQIDNETREAMRHHPVFISE